MWEARWVRDRVCVCDHDRLWTNTLNMSIVNLFLFSIASMISVRDCRSDGGQVCTEWIDEMRARNSIGVLFIANCTHHIAHFETEIVPGYHRISASISRYTLSTTHRCTSIEKGLFAMHYCWPVDSLCSSPPPPHRPSSILLLPHSYIFDRLSFLLRVALSSIIGWCYSRMCFARCSRLHCFFLSRVSRTDWLTRSSGGGVSEWERYLGSVSFFCVYNNAAALVRHLIASFRKRRQRE